MKLLFTKQKNFFLTLISGILLIGILVAIPTGYEDAVIYKDTERAVGEVVKIDDSAIISSGLIQSGEQSCTLKILDGIFKGKEIEGVNFLSGSLEKDKVFQVGDKALVTISYEGDTIKSAVISDHYRLNREFILMGAFALLLILFAGKNGLQAIFSFVITILAIWKILVPCYLKGYSPVWIGILITIMLTAVIIFFVYGWDKRTLVAVLGALLGVATTCILGIVFTNLFMIHGAIMPNAESLLYSGYENLDLTAIFMQHFYRSKWCHDGSCSRYYIRSL